MSELGLYAALMLLLAGCAPAYASTHDLQAEYKQLLESGCKPIHQAFVPELPAALLEITTCNNRLELWLVTKGPQSNQGSGLIVLDHARIGSTNGATRLAAPGTCTQRGASKPLNEVVLLDPSQPAPMTLKNGGVVAAWKVNPKTKGFEMLSRKALTNTICQASLPVQSERVGAEPLQIGRRFKDKPAAGCKVLSGRSVLGSPDYGVELTVCDNHLEIWLSKVAFRTQGVPTFEVVDHVRLGKVPPSVFFDTGVPCSEPGRVESQSWITLIDSKVGQPYTLQNNGVVAAWRLNPVDMRLELLPSRLLKGVVCEVDAP